MNLGILQKDELEFIISSLERNDGMSDEEYRVHSIKHPYAVERDDNILITSTMKHYGLSDNKLNEFILNKFGNEDYNIDFFYELIYSVGSYTNPHRDKKICAQTTLILLSDNFIGGDLIVDNKKVPFNKKGVYLNFDGNKNMHEVKPILSGERRVLVIMFNRKNSII